MRGCLTGAKRHRTVPKRAPENSITGGKRAIIPDLLLRLMNHTESSHNKPNTSLIVHLEIFANVSDAVCRLCHSPANYKTARNTVVDSSLAPSSVIGQLCSTKNLDQLLRRIWAIYVVS